MCIHNYYPISELESVGVTAVRPKGGYYIFPNFECIREPLRRRGAVTCEDMVNLIFRDIAVSVSISVFY